LEYHENIQVSLLKCRLYYSVMLRLIDLEMISVEQLFTHSSQKEGTLYHARVIWRGTGVHQQRGHVWSRTGVGRLSLVVYLVLGRTGQVNSGPE
jgi:hypothetical protein